MIALRHCAPLVLPVDLARGLERDQPGLEQPRDAGVRELQPHPLKDAGVRAAKSSQGTGGGRNKVAAQYKPGRAAVDVQVPRDGAALSERRVTRDQLICVRWLS